MNVDIHKKLFCSKFKEKDNISKTNVPVEDYYFL